VTQELKQKLRGVVWSNANAPDEVYVRAALLRPHFHLLLAVASELGLERVSIEWDWLKRFGDPRVERVATTVDRMLGHIREGFEHAAR
jgi:hypothetical protein